MLTAGESSELERLGLEGQDVEIELDADESEDIEDIEPLPAPSDDLADVDAPWSPQLQRVVEANPIVVSMKKLISRELADARRELRRTLRDVRIVREEFTALSTEHAALRAELASVRLDVALVGEPAARRDFIKALYAAQKPTELEPWLAATLATMTTKGQR